MASKSKSKMVVVVLDPNTGDVWRSASASDAAGVKALKSSADSIWGSYEYETRQA